jgi:hypothetical protein
LIVAPEAGSTSVSVVAGAWAVPVLRERKSVPSCENAMPL